MFELDFKLRDIAVGSKKKFVEIQLNFDETYLNWSIDPIKTSCEIKK